MLPAQRTELEPNSEAACGALERGFRRDTLAPAALAHLQGNGDKVPISGHGGMERVCSKAPHSARHPATAQEVGTTAMVLIIPTDPSLLFLPLSLAAKSVISQEWAVLRAGGGVTEGRGWRASALLLLLQWHSHGRRS